MARILYTVCGIGIGHATRSAEIIEELKKEHELSIVSHGQAFELLSRRFSNSSKLKWFELVFENERYRKSKTFLRNLRLIPEVARHNSVNLYRLAKRFKPDIIISDFDPNGVYLGEILGIPVITITSMHLMNYSKPEMDFQEKLKYYITEKPILDIFNPSACLIIPSFWIPKFRRENEYCFGPILRSAYKPLLSNHSRPRENSHFLVYFHKNLLPEILPLLAKFPKQKFIVYGSETKRNAKNLQFRKFSEEQFSKDLLSSKGVISHGGGSLLSECALLRKPALTFSSKEFYERYHNAWLFQNMGFGQYQEKASRRAMESFFRRLPKYRSALEKANIKPGNKDVVRKINEIIGNKNLI